MLFVVVLPSQMSLLCLWREESEKHLSYHVTDEEGGRGERTRRRGRELIFFRHHFFFFAHSVFPNWVEK